jgi:hypothetical protein
MIENDLKIEINEIDVYEYSEDDDNDDDKDPTYNVGEEIVKTGVSPRKTALGVGQLFQRMTINAVTLLTKKMDDFDDLLFQDTENIINLIGNEQFTAKILNSWQIRVRIEKLKYLLAIKENTSIYVKVNIGEQEFCTQIKQINDLSFNEVVKKILGSFYNYILFYLGFHTSI